MKLSLSLAAMLAMAVTLSATPTCTSVEGDNINSISACTLGGLTFSNFADSSTPTGSTVWLSAVGTGVVSGGVDLGFQLTTAKPPVDILLFYDVAGTGIIGVDNEQNGVNTTIGEVVCSVAFVGGVCPKADVLASFSNPPTQSATFAAQTMVYIEKDISLPDGSSFISSFVNSQETGGVGLPGGVPEPSTVAMIGLGLWGIGWFGRKARP